MGNNIGELVENFEHVTSTTPVTRSSNGISTNSIQTGQNMMEAKELELCIGDTPTNITGSTIENERKILKGIRCQEIESLKLKPVDSPTKPTNSDMENIQKIFEASNSITEIEPRAMNTGDTPTNVNGSTIENKQLNGRKTDGRCGCTSENTHSKILIAERQRLEPVNPPPNPTDSDMSENSRKRFKAGNRKPIKMNPLDAPNTITRSTIENRQILNGRKRRSQKRGPAELDPVNTSTNHIDTPVKNNQKRFNAKKSSKYKSTKSLLNINAEPLESETVDAPIIENQPRRLSSRKRKNQIEQIQMENMDPSATQEDSKVNNRKILNKRKRIMKVGLDGTFSKLMALPQIDLKMIDRSLLEKLVYCKVTEFFSYCNPYREEMIQIQNAIKNMKQRQESICQRLSRLENIVNKKTRSVGVQVQMAPRKFQRSKSEFPAIITFIE